MSMDKNTVQTTRQTQVVERLDEVLPAHHQGKETAQVNVSRRNLFMPLRRKTTLPESDASLRDDSVQENVQQNDLTTEPVPLHEAIATLIRKHSAQSQLTLTHMFLELFTQAPLQVTGDEDKSFVLETPVDLPQDEKLQWIVQSMNELLSEDLYQDIVEVEGQKSHYYYSTHSMSDNYAKLSILAQEKDHCGVVAEVVRFECVTYPRPYSVEMLHYAPFWMTDEEINAALLGLKTKADCQDIQEVRASNDAVYLFSQQHMNKAMAQGLCEWIEVEQFANP